MSRDGVVRAKDVKRLKEGHKERGEERGGEVFLSVETEDR
jgi:hypothetical protein